MNKYTNKHSGLVRRKPWLESDKNIRTALSPKPKISISGKSTRNCKKYVID
jgi:hypothetical protein